MRSAYNTVREVRAEKRNVPDLRTAASVVAIEKIADAYLELGLS